jgi:phosphate uptake regulator
VERKLVRQGRNALTVTLPAKWLKEKGLSAGASVTIKEQNEGLSIDAGLISAKKEITLDLRNSEKSLVWHVVQGKYIEGYDRIIILHDISTLSAEMGSAFLGMIIEEHTAQTLVLKSIVAVPEDSFSALLRRAGHILLEQARLLEQYVSGDAALEQLKDEERLLNYNILYCLRYLNKYESKESSYKYFLLCSSIESTGDQLMHLAKNMAKGSAKSAELSKAVSNCLENYLKHLFLGDFKKAYSVLRSFRDSLEQKTFVDGIAFSLAETLYNYIGYLIEYEAK